MTPSNSQRQAHLDRSLLDANRLLTPRQRLEQLERVGRDLEALRAAVSRRAVDAGSGRSGKA